MLNGLYKVFLDRVAPSYQRLISQRLRNYGTPPALFRVRFAPLSFCTILTGLNADDLLIETPALKKALTRIDPALRVARYRQCVFL
jgi:hypothetical protein